MLFYEKPGWNDQINKGFCHGVDIDVTDYTTKYTTMTKRNQNFPTVTKLSLINLYLNQNSSISLATSCYRLAAGKLAFLFKNDTEIQLET